MSDEDKIDDDWTVETQELVATVVGNRFGEEWQARIDRAKPMWETWWQECNTEARAVLRALADAGILAALSVPSEPVRPEPRVWAMPEIPEDVMAVKDRDGGCWTRATFDGRMFWRQIGPIKIDDHGIEETHLWTGTLSLLRDRGPLTEVVEEATP